MKSCLILPIRVDVFYSSDRMPFGKTTLVGFLGKYNLPHNYLIRSMKLGASIPNIGLTPKPAKDLTQKLVKIKVITPHLYYILFSICQFKFSKWLF